MSRLQNILLCFTVLFVILSGCTGDKPFSASDVILLLNSDTRADVAITKIIPYLDHFGVKYATVDIAKEAMPSKESDPALIIIGHPEITTNDVVAAQLEQYLKTCTSRGTGILSFDPLMPSHLLKAESVKKIEQDSNVGEFRFSDVGHYITGYRNAGEIKELFGYMEIPKMAVTGKNGSALISGNNFPLLVVGRQEKGNVAQWTSQDWMYYSILGPMGGLDDCLWKSMVWAARKPFVMQALPPIVTMRVDDVLGSGREQWGVSPFQWIKTTNKYGFKPWLGLFIYNINTEAIEELREIMLAGQATATPHAFGRPPRKESHVETIVNVYKPYYTYQLAPQIFVPEYWYAGAIPFLSKFYDEFIFFDHNHQKPWSPELTKKILHAVDDWWYSFAKLPMGNYLLPHWYQIGSGMIDHAQDQWGIEFVGARELDASYGQQNPEIQSSPFRLYDEPVVGKKKENATSARASYIAGFRELAGRDFFDFASEINDITGYEWQPDNDVEASAGRGIRTLSRGLEAKAVAVLFTHETDYIYSIKPENWDAILKKVSEGISGYNPLYLTTDDALQMLRAYWTSEIQEGVYVQKSGELKIKMYGKTDVPTGVYVYTDHNGSVDEKFVEIPVFQDEIEISTGSF